jgi:hypothetical protein
VFLKNGLAKIAEIYLLFNPASPFLAFLRSRMLRRDWLEQKML